MQTTSRKGILTVLFAIFLVASVAVIPDIISNEMREWCIEMFGPGFAKYLLGCFILGTVGVLFLTTDVGKYLGTGAKSKPADRYNIPPGPRSRQLLAQARSAIGQAEPEQALRALSDLKIAALDGDITALSGRFAEYRRSSRQGVNTPDKESRTFNKINKEIFELIKSLEKELAIGSENYQTIKDYLKKRYSNRLDQKLAKRQPVSLRRLVNTEVVPQEMAPAFIPYSSTEISGALLQTFHDARGRLLLVGAPGAGKTTLMLQLVLELLESETDALPVLLNLATWSKEYITLEAWLKKILPAEAGTGDRYAAEIIQQNRLLPLFDGFDEIREEDRLSCLEAINRYGEDGQRQYVISSRIKEFTDVNKAILIHLPIEVCPLTFEQMKSELQRLWADKSQPERGARLLLDAIERDTNLYKAVQTPFYFNTLQILFSGGKMLADLQFKADTWEGRQAELRERFVEYELEGHVQQEYPAEKAAHWLSFLASRMTQRNVVAFELRDLQYDWWKWSKIEIRVARLINELINKFIFGIYITLGSGMTAVLYVGLAMGILIGLFIGVLSIICIGVAIWLIKLSDDVKPKIKTKEARNLFWNDFKQIAKKNWIWWLAFELFVGWFLEINNRSLRSGLSVGVFIWLVGVGASIIEYLSSSYIDIIQINTPYQRFHASNRALYFSILQHKLLCYQLRKQGLLPPNLVVFLNEMSHRHILETDGATWRFRHRILQEYFAGLWVEPTDQTKSK